MNSEKKTKSSSPDYFRNWLSVIGKIGSVICFVVICCLFLLDVFLRHKNPYLGIFAYLVAPAFLILSLLLIPVGALIERARGRQAGYVPRFPVIDFNNPLHQKWAYTTWAVITIFLLFSAIGMYQAYNFTESNTFCGRVCHTVMKPEYTAYQQSPHARVNCTHCHVGSGAEWYVRSKVSGAYQVYSVLAHAYSKPIEAPIRNLRPAQETCEQCHWPQKFSGALEHDRTYFLPDEKNSEWKTRLLVFVGGGEASRRKKEGIHWHVTGRNKIDYIATDAKRQEIPWIKTVSPDGKEEIFVDPESGYTADRPPKGEMRRMDCIDCHNRPSHIYRDPESIVNQAMADGAIETSLPYIKREAVGAMLGKYPTQGAAAERIRGAIEKFYREKYPEIWKSQRDKIDRSIRGMITGYQNNFFPEMNVSWKAYPNNIGHFIFPGCFRCHSGRHRNKAGETISNDCENCHAIIAQGPAGSLESKVEGLEFKHPDTATADMWKEMSCSACHTGETAGS